MKCFRIRHADCVEDFLAFTVLDGTGYVQTGGLSMPYIRLDEELLRRVDADGRLTAASFEVSGRGQLMLVPERKEEVTGALVVIPSSRAYRYGGLAGVSEPVVPQSDQFARVVVLQPGQSFTATPVARTIAESEKLKSLVFGFDGERVFVREASSSAFPAAA